MALGSCPSHDTHRACVNPYLIEASGRGEKALKFQPPVSFHLRKHLFGAPACCPIQKTAQSI